MSFLRYSGRKRHRRGATVVEFALTAPLLFLLVMAAIELGRINMILHTTDHAAYEAARAGIVPGADSESIEARAFQVLSTTGVRNAVVTVQPESLDDASEITVSVFVPIGGNAWIAPKLYTYDGIQGQATLNRELTGLN